MPDDVTASRFLLSDAQARRELLAMSRPGRVEETPPRYPSHTVLMLLLSLAFVALALGFSAHLLDLAPATIGPAQLDAVEGWTQLLVGFALTLLLWGSLLLPWMERRGWSWRLRCPALVVGGVIGTLGGALITWGAVAWVGGPDDANGRRAAQLFAVSQGLADAHSTGRGAPAIPPEQLTTPAGRVVLGMMLLGDLHGAGMLLADDGALAAHLEIIATQRVGTAAQLYDNAFVPSVRSLRDAFNRYAEAQLGLADAVRAIPARQDAAWAQFQERMARDGLDAARRELPGDDLPDGWTGIERAPFDDTLALTLRAAAERDYQARVLALFGVALPPGLQWEQFTAHPAVQARWRAALGAPDDAYLSATMGFPAFRDQVWWPVMERAVRPMLAALTAPAAEFAPGGRMEEAGQAAFRWAVVPILALGLVLFCAIWHAAAALCYAGRMAAPGWAGRRWLIGAALACGLIAVLGARGPATRTEGFIRFENWLADTAGPVWLAARAGVEGGRLVHVWGSRARRILMGGYGFGLEPRETQAQGAEAGLRRLIP